jgi:hypothetical protein
LILGAHLSASRDECGGEYEILYMGIWVRFGNEMKGRRVEEGLEVERLF